MRYLLLIYTQEDQAAAPDSPEGKELFDGYMKFGENNKAKIQGGDALQPTATATTVRGRDGKTLTTDGPFAETKEQLGGYYMVDAGDLDEAIAIASQIPNAQDGSIEVRPVLEFDL